MAIETSTRDGSLVVRILENRLDASNSDGLTDELQGLVNEGSSHLILDLSGVTFLDSSALGAIVSIVKDLGDDGKLAVCGLNESPQLTFTLTRVDRIVDIFGTVEEATSAMATP